MIVHNNNQAYTELEQIDTKQADILILRGTLKSMKVTIILIYLSVIRGATERKSNQRIMTEIRRGISHCDDDELFFTMGDFNAHVGSKRHSLQAVELSQRTQAAVQIVSNLPAPSNGGPIYRFLGMPAMRTRWMAGAAAHKSG